MWTAFLIASLLLAITPGPAVVYRQTRTVAHAARRAGRYPIASSFFGLGIYAMMSGAQASE